MESLGHAPFWSLFKNFHMYNTYRHFWKSGACRRSWLWKEKWHNTSQKTNIYKNTKLTKIRIFMIKRKNKSVQIYAILATARDAVILIPCNPFQKIWIRMALRHGSFLMTFHEQYLVDTIKLRFFVTNCKNYYFNRFSDKVFVRKAVGRSDRIPIFVKREHFVFYFTNRWRTARDL